MRNSDIFCPTFRQIIIMDLSELVSYKASNNLVIQGFPSGKLYLNVKLPICNVTIRSCQYYGGIL